MISDVRIALGAAKAALLGCTPCADPACKAEQRDDIATAVRSIDAALAALSGVQAEQQSGWACEIESADFEANTITLQMQDASYVVGAGVHRLVPPQKLPQDFDEQQGSKGEGA
jgi:hypothetical protein